MNPLIGALQAFSSRKVTANAYDWLPTTHISINLLLDLYMHSLPSQAIPASSKYFAKLDVTHGYLQLALSKQASAFNFSASVLALSILTGSHGLSSSSDEWCRHSDRVVEGLSWTKKIVNEILSWAPDLVTLESRLNTIMKRCLDIHVTILIPLLITYSDNC